MRCALRHCYGLVAFVDDGRIEMDTNVVERHSASDSQSQKRVVRGQRRRYAPLGNCDDAGRQREAERRRARLRYLPPYSPDFNPIENAFAKLKALIRKAAARTLDDLWIAIRDALRQFTAAECANYFIAAGYKSE